MEKMIPEVLREIPCPVQCSVCQANFNNNPTDFICLNDHHFDEVAGYTNLLCRRPLHGYSEKLFKARQAFIANGFFDGLERELLQLLYSEYAINDSLTILDAGTGEGALFSNLLLCMRWDQYRHQAIGADHCVQAVRAAAAQDTDALWLVADSTKLPLPSGSVDVILNTFAPANYVEFKRVLQPGGLLLKTVPGQGHLQEWQEPLHRPHGYEQATKLFHQQMEQSREIKVCYRKHLSAEALELVRMAEGLPAGHSGGSKPSTVTIDLIILCGRKPY